MTPGWHIKWSRNGNLNGPWNRTPDGNLNEARNVSKWITEWTPDGSRNGTIATPKREPQWDTKWSQHGTWNGSKMERGTGPGITPIWTLHRGLSLSTQRKSGDSFVGSPLLIYSRFPFWSLVGILFWCIPCHVLHPFSFPFGNILDTGLLYFSAWVRPVSHWGLTVFTVCDWFQIVFVSNGSPKTSKRLILFGF